jgi:hypothetical protein
MDSSWVRPFPNGRRQLGCGDFVDQSTIGYLARESSSSQKVGIEQLSAMPQAVSAPDLCFDRFLIEFYLP